MGQVQSVTAAETGITKPVQMGKPVSSSKPHDPRLWKAAGDFQEVMLAQFTQTMRTSENDSELFEECPGRDTFNQMLSDAIAHQMSKSGALGLNKLIYRAMGGKYEKPPAAGAAPTQANPVILHTEKAE